jgi:ribosomal protein S17
MTTAIVQEDGSSVRVDRGDCVRILETKSICKRLSARVPSSVQEARFADLAMNILNN